MILNDKELTIVTYSYDLYNNKHGICGHTYEAIEYFWILSKQTKSLLLLPEMNKDQLLVVLEDKYNFNKEEVNYILEHTRFEFYNLILVKTIIFTDGGLIRIQEYLSKLLVNNIIFFACGDRTIFQSNLIFKPNVKILYDERVYGNHASYNNISYIHYPKKILFSRFRSLNKKLDNRYLIYGTTNCREVKDYEIQDIKLKYPDKELFFIDTLLHKTIPDFLHKFNSYIYTPTPRKFDCSSRLIPECTFYNKEVIYQIPNLDEYLEIDTGLKYRKFDTENNFESLFLIEEDTKELIC